MKRRNSITVSSDDSEHDEDDGPSDILKKGRMMESIDSDRTLDSSEDDEGSEESVGIEFEGTESTTTASKKQTFETRRFDDFERLDFKSADDSTSVYRSEEDTENGLNRMVVRVDKFGDTPQREINVDFYSKLLPIFIQTNLLLVDLVSIPEEFAHTIIRGQGVRYLFTFENIRIFNLDNATLLLDHRYVKAGEGNRDFIMKIVGRPVNKKLATFPKVLTTQTNVFAGSRETSMPSRHFVRSHILRPNFLLARPVSIKRSYLVEHHFSEGLAIPRDCFWLNVYDPDIRENDDFQTKLYDAIQDRPMVLDLLYLLGEVDGRDNTIKHAKKPAKWEPKDTKDPVDRAAITIHMMLCFGFRIVSFGMLCENSVTTSHTNRQAYAAKRRHQTNTFVYQDTSGLNMKRYAVMRMVYNLDATEAITHFFRIMDTHEQTMKARVLRSLLFYKKTIPRHVVGGSYIYPNNSLYMVLGSCNMLYTAREMNVCTTSSLTNSLLNELTDRPRSDFDDVEETNKRRNRKDMGTSSRAEKSNKFHRVKTTNISESVSTEKRCRANPLKRGPTDKTTQFAEKAKHLTKRQKPVSISPAPPNDDK